MTRRFRVTIGGVTYNVDVEEISQPAASAHVTAVPAAAPAHAPAPVAAPAVSSPVAPAASQAVSAVAPPVPSPVPAPASSPAAAAASPASASSSAGSGSAQPVEGQAVCAPLPGMIVNVSVQVGQQVREGDVVAVLEAMKMENDITSPYAGTVKQVLVSKGTSVAMNDPLVVIG